MGFFNSILDSLGVVGEFEGLKNKMVLLGFESAYFDCITGIIGFSDTVISLALKNGKIIITGKDLYIKKFCEGDVVVCGKIQKIEKY